MTDSPPESTEPPSAPPVAPPQAPAIVPPHAPADKPLSVDWSLVAIWDRLKHHKVVQWTLAYLAVAYTLLHGAEMLGGSLGWPHALLRVFALILIFLVPVVITLAWFHGARGQQRASGTEIMIIAVLVAIGGAFLWRDSTQDHGGEPAAASTLSAAVSVPSPVAADVPTSQPPLPPDHKSIAVLPFTDMSPEHNQQYMSDGIADEILNLLSQTSDLKVIARTSSFAFKGQNLDVAEIAKRLNVAHVLEGSVRTSGKNLRITAQLIRVADSTRAWSDKYDRPLDDIFVVQDEIAYAIAQTLQISLQGGTLERRKGGTRNLEAYQLFLRADEATDQDTRESLDAAERYAKQAIELDPNYGLAWDVLSDVASLRADAGFVRSIDGYEQARKFAQHSLQISPELVTARAKLGYIYQRLDWNWTAADAELKRALAIDPTDPSALNFAGILAITLGRSGEAERLLRAAQVRDPLDPFVMWNLATTYYLADRFDESERTYRQLLAMAPSFGWTRPFLGKALLALGKPSEALTIIEDDPEELNRLMYLPIVLHALGKRAEAEEALEAQIKAVDKIGPFYVAQSFAFRGENDLALAWLERAYREKDSALVMIVGESLFERLADDPRYKAFLRKMKLPESNPANRKIAGGQLQQQRVSAAR
jgi:adenylate cyclase